MILTKIIEQTKSTLASRKRSVSLHVLIEQADDQAPALIFQLPYSAPTRLILLLKQKKHLRPKALFARILTRSA